MVSIEITTNESEQRVDKFLKKYLQNAPLSLIYRIIRKDLKVNGKRVSQKTMLEQGDQLTIYMDEEKFDQLIKKTVEKKTKKQFIVIYEDANVLIVNKPPGLLTHGDNKEKKNTLTNQVISYLIENGDYTPRIEKTFTPAPANRLDRNTSGLVIFGKSYSGIKELNKLFRVKDNIEKYYLTIVTGELTEDLELNNKIIKDERKNKVQILSENSQEGSQIETIAHPIRTNGNETLVQVRLVTGKTHQIRAHMAQAGYPIIGDKKYGNRQKNVIITNKYGLNSQFLHAWRVYFSYAGGELSYLKGKSFEAPLPKKLEQIGEDLNVI